LFKYSFFTGKDLGDGASENLQTHAITPTAPASISKISPLKNHPILPSQQMSGRVVQVINFIARDKIHSVRFAPY
jgi:hypothetical protein